MNLAVRIINGKRAKRVVVRAIACGTLLVLPACRIPNLRPAQTGVAVPPSFNGVTSPDNSARLRVDEFYNDTTLTRLVCQAVASSRELKILEEEIQIASNEVRRRRGAYFPFVTLGTGVGLNRPSLVTPEGALEEQLNVVPGRRFPNPLPNYNGMLNVTWQVDIWRQLRNARDAAVLRYFAAVERRNDFLTRLVADIAQNYYGLMALDQRLATLDRIIALQQKSLETARALRVNARGTELAVQRFQAEVRKNQSEKLIVRQDIIETENRINFLVGRFPQPVVRNSAGFFDLTNHALGDGVPAQLLQYRPDIRQAERELVATGLDIKVARANFFPRLDLTAGVGYEAFNPRYLFTLDALAANVAGNLTAPLINKSAIRADYLNANAQQLQSLYNYQRVIINAFTEVVNQLSRVQNYSRSIELKRQQLQALELAVASATNLFQNPRIAEKGQVDYLDVLTSQRDLMDARTVLINTKRQQLAAIVSVYQALGGGSLVSCPPPDQPVGAPGTVPLPALQPLPELSPAPESDKEKDMPVPQRLPELPQAPAPRKVEDTPGAKGPAQPNP
jgi:NodT family efflux transporter outer membrane factor (OMF) lipoprotein